MGYCMNTEDSDVRIKSESFAACREVIHDLMLTPQPLSHVRQQFPCPDEIPRQLDAVHQKIPAGLPFESCRLLGTGRSLYVR